MQEKLKEPRIYMCLAFFVISILPWMKVESKTKGVAAVSSSVNGYSALFDTFFGIVLMLVVVALLLLELLPQIQVKMSIFYLGGSALGIILSFITFFMAKGGAAAGADAAESAGEAAGVSTKVTSSMQIGFWLYLALFVAIAAYTLIKDFAVNKDAIKEQGIKGVFTDVAGSVTKELSENANMLNVGNGIADMVSVKCPNCGASVIKGKKFCRDCGQRMPDAQPQTVPVSQSPGQAGQRTEAADRTTPAAKSFARTKPRNVQTVPDMMTVREYINTLGNVPCAKCGEQVPVHMKFCPNCGDAVVVKVLPEKCESCGGIIPHGKKFCPDCGHENKEKELQTNCKKCNAELMFGKNFCVECGAKVEA